MKIVKNILMFIWQLPQNILGLVLRLFYYGIILHTDVRDIPVWVCFSGSMYGGISLGQFVFVPLWVECDSDFVKHELGHCRQSQYLGWLYLIVIGLPSIIWACIHTCSKKIRNKYSYYVFYTERWADKLGGVHR